MESFEFEEGMSRFDCGTSTAETDHDAGVHGLRARMAQQGYRLLHRRKEEYWVMFSAPMTLRQIEVWIDPQNAQ
jgi:hypothetical protein